LAHKVSFPLIFLTEVEKQAECIQVYCTVSYLINWLAGCYCGFYSDWFQL